MNTAQIIKFPFERTAEGRQQTDYDKWAKMRVEEGEYVPAYCDPRNEVKGDKYMETAHLDIKDIAKLVRQELKKKYPVKFGWKWGVRISRFSGGQSLTIKITGVPKNQKIFNLEYLAYETDYEYLRMHEISMYESAIIEALEFAEELSDKFNRKNIDSMSDYFDVNFYSSAGVDWELASQAKKEEKKPLE